MIKGFRHRKIIFEIRLQKDLLIFSYSKILLPVLKYAFILKLFNLLYLIMFGRFLFSLDVNTITVYGIHIQLIMLIMPNKMENESKNCVQINKMAIE